MSPSALPLPDPDRLAGDIAELASLTEPDRPGWTRRALGDVYRAGREDVARRFREAGLETHLDAAGNVVGVLPGRDGGPALVTGSHTDTVDGGGRFDGVVGVLGALAALECAARAGRRFSHDVWVIDFYGEEPNEFGLSCLGSRAVTGALSAADLARRDSSGRTLGDAMETAGLDPNGALAGRWHGSDLLAFVELHVEQGPRLETEGRAIGVVSSIAGIQRVVVTLSGRRDHAGTMPVERRHDAACAAAEVVLAVERIGRDGGVATAGRIEVAPGSLNVVPERALVWVELRSVDDGWLERARTSLTTAARAAADARGVGCELRWLSAVAPTPMATSVSVEIEAAARGLGHQTLALPSGAGHDSAHLARLAPTGMVFVPSRDGRSHCPEEWTDAAELAVGAQVLAESLLRLDTGSGAKA